MKYTAENASYSMTRIPDVMKIGSGIKLRGCSDVISNRKNLCCMQLRWPLAT
jgi:hypothetical protein